MRRLGAILAGGRSRRFGSDKALADVAGMPMIVRVAALLAPHVDAVILCGHSAPPAGLVAVPDHPAPDLGPLGGIAGALRHAAAEGYGAVMTIGCDTPMLAADLLTGVAGAHSAAYVRRCPVIGRWPVMLAEPLARHLAEGGDRSMRGWAEAVGAVAIDTDDAIPNLNTPADLARCLARHPGRWP